MNTRKSIFDTLDVLKPVLADIGRYGSTYFVGGFVRDRLLGIPSKDIDIEVFGVPYEKLIEILTKHGKVNVVGASFGVIKFHLLGIDVDFSLPRKDSRNGGCSGEKGRGITVQVDHNITMKEAAARRDFTINSIMVDTQTLAILDYYNGISDLFTGRLHATSEAFAEDPLRVLRGFQFAGRFGFYVDSDTAELCRSLVDAPLVKERECEEWMKFFTQSKHPSAGIDYLQETSWITRYPEIYSMCGVEQDIEWHPEGDVLTHTKHAMNALLSEPAYISGDTDEKAALMAATLCHDFGKRETTTKEFDYTVQRPRIRSAGHAAVGADKAREFLTRIGMKPSVVEVAVSLVRHHMAPCDFAVNNNVVRTMRSLNEKLYPAQICQLKALVTADTMGRPPLNHGLTAIVEEYFHYAFREGFAMGPLKRLINGADILEKWSKAPKSKLLGEAIAYVQSAYINAKVDTKEDGVKLALDFLRKKCALVSGKDLIELGFAPSKAFAELLNLAWDYQTKLDVVDKAKLISMIKESRHAPDCK